MQIMIKLMFIRCVYFICKMFPDIGKIIIELASNFFFVRDGLAVHLYFVRSHRVLFRFVKYVFNCILCLFNVPFVFIEFVIII